MRIIKIMTTLLTVLWIVNNVYAQSGNVKEDVARQVATNFLMLKDNNPKTNVQLTRVNAMQYPNLYVYNTSDNGFIVVASDNRMEPILAYSDEGIFDKDNIAPGANFWLEMYEYVIDSIVKNDVKGVDEQIAINWKNLIAGRKIETNPNVYYPDNYGPLIMTNWGQGSISYPDYNKFCPVLKEHPECRAVTGCVATALGQVLNYFISQQMFSINTGEQIIEYAFRHDKPEDNYPHYSCLVLEGVYANFMSELKNGCNLPDRNYYRIGGWNQYSGIDYAAKIMLDCGLAVDMIYGHSSSAKTISNQNACYNASSAENAMRTYFGLNKAFGKYKLANPQQWQDTLKKYICHNIPIIYAGTGNDGSHAFICDGYDETGRFHFNMGHDGIDNAYYFIYDIDKYNYNQRGLFAYPIKDDYVYVDNLTIQYGQSTTYQWCNIDIPISKGDKLKITANYLVYNHPGLYRILNKCQSNSTYLLLNVLVKPSNTYNGSATICRRDDYVYKDESNNFHIHFSRDETDFSGEKKFNKSVYDDTSGEYLGVCEITLTTSGEVTEIGFSDDKCICQLGDIGVYIWDVFGDGSKKILCPASGRYEYVKEKDANNDCETLYYLDLTIRKPNNMVLEEITTCTNEYTWDKTGQSYYNDGGIRDIYYCGNCDDDNYYVLRWNCNPNTTIEEEIYICIDKLPYPYHGITIDDITQAGLYQYDVVEHSNDPNGCDMTYTLYLTVLEDCCTVNTDCLEDQIEENNVRDVPNNKEAIYYGLKHYYNYRDAINGFLTNVFKGVYWTNEERNVFWNSFQSLLDANTGLMTEQNMQQLIATNECQSITEDYIVDLVERYNRSVMYWDEGIYSIWYLPQGYNPNFIEYDTASMNKAYDALEYARSHGFSDVRTMYDNAYQILESEVENTQSSVCAHVTVKFTQKMTMTREAFNGTLQIFNGHESLPMQDIMVDFMIKDQNGNDCTNLFQINTLSLDQITGISGDGSLAAQTSGTALVQFIPTRNAAPTQPTIYYFGGSFSFIDPFTGEGLTYPLYPVDITVNPSPDLYVDYFMQRDILGDDALTLDVVEPSVPAELGVIIHNQGAGMAKNVLLETAEPQIIDNEKGLAIDFAMYGASFNGSPRQLGLMGISFGNIESGQTAVGEWLFTSSLLGHFVSYEAHVIHNSSYGNSDLSLVSHLDIHELIHPVYAYGNLNDGINDFLVNDNPDAYDTPDSIYFSHGGKTAVGIVDNISYDHVVTALDTIVTLTINPSRIGWNYGVTSDPGADKFELVSCTRNSDGQEIPLSNIWQTFVTIPDGGDPVYENKLHIVDTLSNDVQDFTYTLVYSLKTNLLDVEEITGIPEGYIEYPLENFTVRFNKAIIDSTFSYEDMTLKCQNGPDLMNESVIITKVADSIFDVNISSLTVESGLYVLNVNTLNIRDLKGFGGYNGKQATWIQVLTIDTVFVFGAQTICDNMDYEPITAIIQGNAVSYQWNLNGNPIEGANDTTYLPVIDGNYSLTVEFENNSFVTSNEITLSYYPTYYTHYDDESCAGEAYFWGGILHPSLESGHYGDTIYFTTNYGCDSISTLSLNVWDLYEINIDAEISLGEDYTENGFNIITPSVGVHYETLNLQSIHGCDSIINLTLTVNGLHQHNDTLYSGWNWFSTYIDLNGDDGLLMLENSINETGVVIKSQIESLVNYEILGNSYWFGDLESITNESSYMINVSANSNTQIIGELANHTNHPITIKPQWTWIGYPVNVSQTVSVALDGFNPSNEDIIKTHDASASYNENDGWCPPDFMLIPGQGYKYKSNADTNKILVYNVDSKIQTKTENNNHMWHCNHYAFANNLTIIATVYEGSEMLASDDIELGAFVGDECRGSVILRHYASRDCYYAILTVSGENGEEVHFGIINNHNYLTNFNSNNKLVFENDSVIGSMSNPYEIVFTTGSNSNDFIGIYPNPVKKGEKFNIAISDDEIINEVLVTDILGSIVHHIYGDVRTLNGITNSGVYDVRITAKSGNTYHGRLVVN